MDPDSVCMQYKATHPLWGLRRIDGLRSEPTPKPFTPLMRMQFLADFRERCCITSQAWESLAPVLAYELREDLGVDSYFAIGFAGEFPEGHEYAGCTLPEVLRGLRVQVALAGRGK